MTVVDGQPPMDRYPPPADDFFESEPQKSLAIPHPWVGKFVHEEFGWPQMGYELFGRECDAAGSSAVRVKGVSYARADVVREMLRSLAGVPFVDPDNEVATPLLYSALGVRSNSGFKRYHTKEPFEPFVSQRRRGVAPEPYRIVPAITVTGAVKLALHIASRKEGALVGISAVDLVAGVQEEYIEEQKKGGISPARLSFLAIDRFMAASIERLADTERHFVGLPPPSPRKPLECDPQDVPMIELDESYDLSLHGIDWRTYAACRYEDPDLFLSTEPNDVERALDICGRCVTKGDCLSDTLTSLVTQNHPPEGTFGGTTQAQRDDLSYREAKGLLAQLEATRPSAPDAAPGLRRLLKLRSVL